MSSGNQECVICKKEGLKWFQKWRLFFKIPYKCVFCNSEYEPSTFNDEKSISFRIFYYWFSFLVSFFNAFFPFYLIAVVTLFWIDQKTYSLLLISLGVTLVLLMMYIVPVYYIEDNLRNRIIRKRRIVEQNNLDKAKSKQRQE